MSSPRVRELAIVAALSAAAAASSCRSPAPAATGASPSPAGPTTGAVAQALHATPGGVDILTFHGDNARTGWNSHETVLTPANVRPETFGLLAVSHDVGDEVTGSPLFASNITVHDQRTGADSTGDVVFIGTMDAHVYALDGDTLESMWEFDFEGHHSVSADVLQSCQQPYHVGVMGTPVISPDRQTMYVVGRVSTDDPTNNWLQGYALSTHDGSVRGRFIVGETLNADNTTRTPLVYHGHFNGAPMDVSFQSNMYYQRSALLLDGNYLYVSVGGICDVPGFRGWIFAYDVTHLDMHAAPAAVWVPAPGGGGGMWAGGGQASDGHGGIFVAIGNGRTVMRSMASDANRQVSGALVKLSPTLELDAHSCFNASTLGACGGADATNLTNVFMPRNAEFLSTDVLGDPDDIQGPDEDFGSSGPMLLPDATLPENMGTNMGRHLAAMGGKDGFFYLIDRDHMGGIGPSMLTSDDDFPHLVGAELWGQEIFLHSTSGGIRSTAAYFEGHSGRYIYTIGVDPTSASDAAQGIAALRVVPVTDPSPAACAGQFRETAHNMLPLPCPTIWGSAMRPGYEVAWTGTGPTNNGGLFVSSNGNSDGIVWGLTDQGGGDGIGLLQAYPAEAAGTGNVLPPLYRSDRVMDDAIPGSGNDFASPVVANGHVYVTGSTFIAVYGLLDAPRALPPLPEPPTPPNCPDGVTWESFGQPFMTHYCTHCHGEYNSVGFIQRRHDRVAESIAPAMGGPARMPLNNDPSMPNPVPTADEIMRAAAWLRCGAPAARERVHAGYGDVSAPDGAWLADYTLLDPNRAGSLSADLYGPGSTSAALANPFAPYAPDGLFHFERTGASEVRIPVAGAGHYALTLFASCPSDGSHCDTPFDVQAAGHPWLSGFNLAAASHGAGHVVAASTTVDLAAGSQLVVDVGDHGRVNAIEAVRTDACTTDDQCPLGFACSGGQCAVSDCRMTYSVCGDAGVVEGGMGPMGDGGPGGWTDDAGVTHYDDGATGLQDGAVVAPDGAIISPMPHGCGCRAAGGDARGGALALGAGALALVAAQRRRRRRR